MKSLRGFPYMTPAKIVTPPPCHCHKSADFVTFVYFLGTPSPHPLWTSYMEALQPPSPSFADRTTAFRCPNRILIARCSAHWLRPACGGRLAKEGGEPFNALPPSWSTSFPEPLTFSRPRALKNHINNAMILMTDLGYGD